MYCYYCLIALFQTPKFCQELLLFITFQNVQQILKIYMQNLKNNSNNLWNP